MGSSGRLVIERASGRWEEAFDLCAQLQAALVSGGYAVLRQEDWLQLPAADLLLHPELLEVSPQDEGGLNTGTAVTVAHPRHLPGGLYECQRALGENLATAVASGFEGWVLLDLPPLLQAVTGAGRLPVLELRSPDHPAAREAVLGGVFHHASLPAPVPEAHPFCPCCLLTNTQDAFATEFAGDAFLGIHLFALRDQSGQIRTECRINGVDCAAGAGALARYACQWPDRGFEVRKQYVVVHSPSCERC